LELLEHQTKRKIRKMPKKSHLESKFFKDIKTFGIPEPEREYHFHPTRRWRFDGAYPDKKIAFEIEGGVYQRGRHTRASGFIGDCEKYNEAARLGWRVFRFPSPWITDKEKTAIAYLMMVLEEE